jgi:hypothetical protein
MPYSSRLVALFGGGENLGVPAAEPPAREHSDADEQHRRPGANV